MLGGKAFGDTDTGALLVRDDDDPASLGLLEMLEPASIDIVAPTAVGAHRGRVALGRRRAVPELGSGRLEGVDCGSE